MQFLLEVVDILLNYVRKTFDRSTKVLDFHHPHQLLEGMEGFNLELSDHPESLEQILVDCRDTLKYGVRTGKGVRQEPCPPSHPCQLMIANRGEGRRHCAQWPQDNLTQWQWVEGPTLAKAHHYLLL